MGSLVFKKHGIDLEQKTIEVDEVQSEDPKYITEQKAKAIYQKVGQPLIISDDNWEITELNGFPGPYMKSVNAWFGFDGWVKISKILENKQIFLNSYVAYIDKMGVKIFNDRMERIFVDKPPGTHHSAPILRCISLPDDPTPIVDVWNNNPEKLAKNRYALEDLAKWINAKNQQAS